MIYQQFNKLNYLMTKKNLNNRCRRLSWLSSCGKVSSNGYEIIGIDNMLGGYEDNIPSNINFIMLIAVI